MLLDKSDGFFLDFYTKIRKTLSENEFNDFVVLENGEQRVAFVSRVLEQHTFPSEVWRESNKDDQTALRCKEDGNKLFQKNEFPNALKLYSKSILHVTWTEQDNETLSILLANRSAALYHLEQFDTCLSDIDYALQLGGYPRNLRYKCRTLQQRAKNWHLHWSQADRTRSFLPPVPRYRWSTQDLRRDVWHARLSKLTLETHSWWRNR
ncbi:hypothetical protein B566_EDAN009388, partial [Ephemera danica]